jgi:hypothetical protein
MGLFDRLRGRRDSEDAFAQARAEAAQAGEAEAAAAPTVPPPGDPSLGIPLTSWGTPQGSTEAGTAENVQIPGIGGVAELQALIAQAAAQGHLHVDVETMQMAMPGAGAMGMPAIDLRSNPEKRAVVFEILRKHGLDPHEGQAIQVTDPQIQAEIFQALQQPPSEQPPPSS